MAFARRTGSELRGDKIGRGHRANLLRPAPADDNANVEKEAAAVGLSPPPRLTGGRERNP
jgi:hypothetical protein